MTNEINRLLKSMGFERGSDGSWPAEAISTVAETMGLPDYEVMAWLDDPGVPPHADYRRREPDK